MRAAVILEPKKVQVQLSPRPEPGPRQARVRLEGCGLCGSNLPPWEGRSWFGYPFEPGAPGHEGWGQVDAIGPGVTTVKVGARVALLSQHAFAEYDLADEESIVPVPDRAKMFPGEALGCAMNIFKRSDIQAGQTVAIIGIGFLGALLVQLAARSGARVIAISRRPFALEMAKACGAGETLPMADQSEVAKTVQRLTDGRGCERVIEATGLQVALDLATELLQERSRLIIAGYHQDESRQVDMQRWNWLGVDVINAHERAPSAYVAGMKAAAEAVASGALQPEALYTHTFALDRIADAFHTARQRPPSFLKAHIRCL